MSTTISEQLHPPEAEPGFRRKRGRPIITGLLLLVLMITMSLTMAGSLLWQTIGLAVFLIAIAVTVLLIAGTLLITPIVAAVSRRSAHIVPWLRRLLRFFLVLVILLAALGGAAIGSQWTASTPPITGADGKPLPGSIATLEQVTLNGSQQWITIRGKNAQNPILLYLGIGGPGGGGLPNNAMSLAPLEEHFVVVNWDQPGTGKSYNAVPISTLTPQRFVDDAHALVQMLRTRFQQDKIYVLGDSWGTILGIWLVQKYPDMFYAFVGRGQMVNTTENDVMGYQLALKYATERGDTRTVETLRRNGPPPYAGDGMALKYLAYLDVLNSYMESPSFGLILPLAAQITPEYGLIDKVNFMRGLYEEFTVLYPQLKDLDFTKQAASLQVPIYFFVGRNDVNAMASLVERYYNVLQAPHKELVWFEHSGHGTGEADARQFVDVMVNRVLKQTHTR